MANTEDALRQTICRLLLEKDGPNRKGKPKAAKLAKAMGLSTPWATMYLDGQRGIPLDRLDGIAAYLNLSTLGLFDIALGGGVNRPVTGHGVQRPVQEAGAHVATIEARSEQREVDRLRREIRGIVAQLGRLAGAESADRQEAQPAHRVTSGRRSRRRGPDR